MKKTGELLKAAREEKGLSLHEVGIFLKINTRILQAIEDGDLARLPAKTFLRGFVQSYSKYLKLNTDEVLRIFQLELKPRVEMSENLTDQKIEAENKRVEKDVLIEKPIAVADSNPTPTKADSTQTVFIGQGFAGDKFKQRSILISILCLTVVFVIYFGNNLIKRYKREAELPTEITGLERAKDSANVASSVLLNEKKTEGDLFNEKVAAVSSQPASAKTLALSPGPSAVPVSSVNSSAAITASKLVKESSEEKPTSIPITPVAPVTQKELAQTRLTPPPTQQVTINETTSLPTQATLDLKPAPEGKPIEVIVEARENVEIEYSSAKSNPQKLLLKGDQIHTFKSRSGVKLKISNGGSVNVIVNGQDLGAPGAPGQSIQLSYD